LLGWLPPSRLQLARGRRFRRAAASSAGTSEAGRGALGWFGCTPRHRRRPCCPTARCSSPAGRTRTSTSCPAPSCTTRRVACVHIYPGVPSQQQRHPAWYRQRPGRRRVRRPEIEPANHRRARGRRPARRGAAGTR